MNDDTKARIILDQFPFRNTNEELKLLGKLTRKLKKPILYSFPSAFSQDFDQSAIITLEQNVLENTTSLKGLFISYRWQSIFVCAKTTVLIFDLSSRQLKLKFQPGSYCGDSLIEDFTNVIVEENVHGYDDDALILSHSGIHNGFIITFDLKSVLNSCSCSGGGSGSSGSGNKKDETAVVVIWKKALIHIPSGMYLRYNVVQDDMPLTTHNYIYSVDFSEILILDSKTSNIVTKIKTGSDLSPFSICFAPEEEHFVFVCEFVSVSMFKEEKLNSWTRIAQFKHPSMLLPSVVLVDPITKQVLILSDGNMHIFNYEDNNLVAHYTFPTIKNPLGAYWLNQTGELFISDSYSRKIFILK